MMVYQNNIQNNRANKGQYNNYSKRESDSEIKNLEDYFIRNILKVSKLRNEYDTFIEQSKKYAKFLSENKMTTSQIRKVYSDILNAKDAMDLKRLRPKLAYIYGRNSGKGIRSFITVLDKGIENLDPQGKEEEIKSLKEFAETIVAYRKFYGDKE